MPSDPEEDRYLARRARRASLVIVLAMTYWIAALLLGRWLGWDPRLAFAFDIGAIIALLWALWIVWTVYVARRDQKDR